MKGSWLMGKRATIGLLVLLLVLMSTLLLPACKATAPGEPVKIGWLVPMMGPFTINGTEMTRGIKLYFDEIGWKAGGRQITMIEEDTEATPAVGVQKVRKVIESDRVHLVAGITSTAVAYAIKDPIVAAGIPLIITNAAATELTRKDAHPNIFRVSYTSSQHVYDLASWVAQKRGWDKITYIYADFAPGREVKEWLVKGLDTWGGKIIQEMAFPLGTVDFAPYLAKISKEAKAVYAMTPADDQSIRFVKQWAEFGLKDKIPLFGGGYLTHHGILPQQGDAALGIEEVFHYYPTVDTPENKKFVKAYREKYNALPAPWTYQGYLGGQVIARALEAVKGNVEDKPGFLAAVKKVEFKGPTGTFRFDDKNQVIVNAYWVKVEKVKGELTHTIIDTRYEVRQRME